MDALYLILLLALYLATVGLVAAIDRIGEGK
jgi:hypothetical protein